MSLGSCPPHRSAAHRDRWEEVYDVLVGAGDYLSVDPAGLVALFSPLLHGVPGLGHVGKEHIR